MTLLDIAPYLFVGLILIINIALWSSFKRRKDGRQNELWQKASEALQKPWEKENQDYRELSERVKNLREKPSGDSQAEE